VSWTISSEQVGYDSVNYGLFYEDVMLARIALRHAQIAKDLKVKSVMQGECGHAHKAFMPIADRVFPAELNVPRESCFPILEDIVCNEKIMLDPSRNNFPVTLHDPCNVTRSMGIVEPQRRILRKICPQFREMTPHGVNNYCCLEEQDLRAQEIRAGPQCLPGLDRARDAQVRLCPLLELQGAVP